MKRIIMLTFLGSLMLGSQARAAFIAYNDLVYDTSGNNSTSYSLLPRIGSTWTSSGLLRDFGSGLFTGVTVTATGSNITIGAYGPNDVDGTGSYPGGPAAATFNGIITQDATASYDDALLPWEYTVTFSGLDPAKEYDFITTADRQKPAFAGPAARFTKFTISGAVSFTNTNPVTMDTGNNSAGLVAQWSNIKSGLDGMFSVKSEWEPTPGVVYLPPQEYKSYGMEAFKLEEIDPIPAGPGSVPEPSTFVAFSLVAFGLCSIKRFRKA